MIDSIINGYLIMISCLANLTLINHLKDKEIGNTPPEKYLRGMQEQDEETLLRHFIPCDRDLWKLESYQVFLQERLNLIWEATAGLLDGLS